MPETGIHVERFVLVSEGLRLPAFLAVPKGAQEPFPCVQIHHAGGGYEPIYEHMAMHLAERGIAGATLVHRGYPGAEGEMEYGKGEILDIGNFSRTLMERPEIDAKRMGIMGYSRGAHNALLAIERYDFFRAGALWSTPTDMVDHVLVNPWIARLIGGLHEEVPEEYEVRSSILYVDRIQCPLLLIHGEQDDVVPVRHTVRLAEALERHGKPFELKLFPDEGHIWSTAGFANNWRLTVDFFQRHLLKPGRGS